MSKLRDLLVAGRSRKGEPRQSQTMPVPARVVAHVRAEGCSGLRHIQIRDFQLINDAGPDCAGFDLGPTQFELVLGALGSCLTQTFLEQAAAQQVAVNHVEVNVSGWAIPASDGNTDEQAGPRDIRFEFMIDSAADAFDIERIRQAVEQNCPLLHLLVQPQSIRGTMVHGNGDTPDGGTAPN